MNINKPTKYEEKKIDLDIYVLFDGIYIYRITRLKKKPPRREAFFSDLDRSRTCNRLIRSQVLYPIELRGQYGRKVNYNCTNNNPYLVFIQN